MRNNFYYMFSIAKKEYKEIRRSLLKLLYIFILPLFTIIAVGMNEGTSGVFTPKMNILATFAFAGLFSAILLKDSLTREKRQHTLEILLTSKIKFKYIIMGKILPVLLIGIVLQLVELGILYSLLVYKGSAFTALVSVQSMLLMPFIYYIMNGVILIVSVIVNDEKASDMLAISLALMIGVGLLYLADFMGALSIWYMFLLAMIIIMVLDFLVTLICEQVLVKSMFFIKI